jgi:acyl-CoA thioester hydrolase
MARTRIDLPDSFPFSITIPVRITDVNYGGHLGNDAVLGLVHEARIAFLAGQGYTELDVAGAGIIMAEATVLYRAEAFRGDLLKIEAAVGEVTGHGFELLHRITKADGGTEVARVRTGFAFFDYKARKIARVPAEFLKRYGRISP